MRPWSSYIYYLVIQPPFQMCRTPVYSRQLAGVISNRLAYFALEKKVTLQKYRMRTKGSRSTYSSLLLCRSMWTESCNSNTVALLVAAAAVLPVNFVSGLYNEMSVQLRPGCDVILHCSSVRSNHPQPRQGSCRSWECFDWQAEDQYFIVQRRRTDVQFSVNGSWQKAETILQLERWTKIEYWTCATRTHTHTHSYPTHICVCHIYIWSDVMEALSTGRKHGPVVRGPSVNTRYSFTVSRQGIVLKNIENWHQGKI